MRLFFYILILFLFVQCDTESKKVHPPTFEIYYGFMDYKKSINTNLSGKYDQSWADFLQTATLDTSFMLTDEQIAYLDTSYSNLAFCICKSDSIAFNDFIEKGSGLFIIRLNNERLFAGRILPMAIAVIQEYPHLRYLNYPPDTDEQILELWGQGYHETDVHKIIEHFKRLGKIKSK